MNSWGHDDSIRGGFRRVTLDSIDDTGGQQLFKGSGLLDEPIGEAVRSQNFGHTSNPPAGAEGLLVALGGRSERSHIIGLEHSDTRSNNHPPGTSVLYDDKGNVIRAYAKDGIQVEAQSGDIWVKPAAGKNLYHGGNPGDGGTYLRVKLEDDSVSVNVYAKKA